MYIADPHNHVVRKISPSGIISVFAGTGTSGYTGDGGPATSAELVSPWGVRVNRSGDVFISDFDASVVREVNTNGTITTVAGTGTPGYTGDHGPATSAELEHPEGLFVDASNNLFIADEGAHVVREVNAAGTITTAAGNGTSGTTGDGGPATAAELEKPTGVVEDNLGDLFIADYAVSRCARSTWPRARSRPMPGPREPPGPGTRATAARRRRRCWADRHRCGSTRAATSTSTSTTPTRSVRSP